MCQPPKAKSPAETASISAGEIPRGLGIRRRQSRGRRRSQPPPGADDHDDRRHLHTRDHRLHPTARTGAHVVDGRQHDDGAHRQQARGGVAQVQERARHSARTRWRWPPRCRCACSRTSPSPRGTRGPGCRFRAGRRRPRRSAGTPTPARRTPARRAASAHPPAARPARRPAAVGTRAVISEAWTKIDAPMMVPTTSAVACESPMTRARRIRAGYPGTSSCATCEPSGCRRCRGLPWAA